MAAASMVALSAEKKLSMVQGCSEELRENADAPASRSMPLPARPANVLLKICLSCGRTLLSPAAAAVEAAGATGSV